MDGIFWILGSPDAEMSAIESLLRQCGQRVYVALAPTMRLDPVTGTMRPVLDEQGLPVYGRVAPGQVATGAAELLADGTEGAVLRHTGNIPDLVAVEVAGPWGQAHIDHHGHAERAEWGPDRFLQASSLGQVISRLAIMGALPESWHEDVIGAYSPAGQIDSDGQGYLVWGGLTGAHADGGGLGEFDIERIWRIPQALVFEAAADHCPAAAIAGRCPGVDPGALAPFLAESKRRQYFPWMSPEDFARELEISRATLRASPPVTEFCEPHPAGFSPDLEDVYIVGATPADCPVGTWVAPGSEDDGDGGAGLAIDEWTYIVRHDPDGTPVGVVATPQHLAMRDLRHLEPGTVPAQGSGEMYPAEFLVGIVAALFEGLGFVCRIRRADGKLALRSNGHGQGTLAGTRPAEVFLADPSAFGCGPRFPPGQDASYGSPVRGFFGGLLLDQD